jgi:protein TonB
MTEEAPAAAPTPRPTPHAPISGGVLNGKAIRLVTPPYPAIARSAHASGQVSVQVLIDENGNVLSATPTSGHPLLRAAAQSAAMASKFSPTKLSGQPVKVNGVIIYNFVAQ